MQMNLLERIRSDILYIRGFRKLIAVTSALEPDSEFMLGDFIESRIDAAPDNVFIVFEGEEITYAAFDRRANQWAHWGLSVGLRPGDAVALFMGNKPDYIAFWAGMAKIAVRTALINYNLTGPGLAHCITIAKARALVMDADLAPAFDTIRESVALDLGAWTLGAAAGGGAQLDPILPSMSQTRPERAHRAGLKVTETAMFIYTSGTTGLPKAAKITNLRAQGLLRVFVPAVDVKASDRIFLTLPLYHATGGMCGVGCALSTGATLLLQRRFSASHFWQDAIDTRANMIVYIGELGRYLMNQPPSALERSHSIVKGFGNGLRPDVWAEFVERTGVRRLVEFYGSTEGNVNFFNLDGKIGAVGRIPPILRGRIKARLIKFDVEKEEPIRGPDGFCIEADVDEPGEAIGPISENVPRERFDGYNDEAQSRKKILTNVFAPGDRWFRTGDLMKRDGDGYIYFVDRIGDTFRWKSENVSTGEVELAITSFPGVKHAVVYGVEVPGQDGRAGMAAITAEGLDLANLYAHLSRRLPPFARPVFLRLQKEAETTGTLKYRKVDLVRAGFDPKRTGEPVYVIDAQNATYTAVDGETLRRIETGHMRL
jgi:fatty-acyl-CoA synthase